MANDALIALLVEIVKTGGPIVADMVRANTGKDIEQMPATDAIQAVRAIRIRSVEELEAEGRKLAEEDDDGA